MNCYSIEDAREIAESKVTHSTQLLIAAVLSMYDKVYSKTLSLMVEMNKRQQAEASLKLFKRAFDTSLEAMFITDKQGMMVDANPAFCTHVQKKHADITSYSIQQLKPALFHQSNIQQAWKHTDKHGHWAGEIHVKGEQSSQETQWLSLSSITNDHGMITHYAGVLSSAAQLIEQRNFLENEVNYDALTRLPNRRLFRDRLQQAMSKSERNQTVFAVCFLDLDGFKPVRYCLIIIAYVFFCFFII